MQHSLVKIVWKDAFAAPQGWTSLEDYRTEPAHPVTVGWLLPDVLDGYITTADTVLTQDGDTTYYNIGHIPNEMILLIEYLDKPNGDKIKKNRKDGKK